MIFSFFFKLTNVTFAFLLVCYYLGDSHGFSKMMMMKICFGCKKEIFDVREKDTWTKGNVFGRRSRLMYCIELYIDRSKHRSLLLNV